MRGKKLVYGTREEKNDEGLGKKRKETKEERDDQAYVMDTGFHFPKNTIFTNLDLLLATISGFGK